MPRHEPERTCIVTRQAGSPETLIRFVVAPSGEVVPDLRNKLPGRGAWVTARAETVREAARRKLFSRAFKREVTVPPDLAESIDASLLLDLRQALALANKAGTVVTGFGKVEATLRGVEKVAALVHAAEAAPDGKRKLAGALRNRLGDAISSFPIVDELPEADLDMALGGSHVIHAALVAGAGSDGFVARWRRLRTYRGLDADAVGLEGEPGRNDPLEPAGLERD
jgi:hypothetical protein